MKHGISDLCGACGDHKKGFDRICKQQGTFEQMNELRKTDEPQWLKALSTYKDTRGGRGFSVDQGGAVQFVLCSAQRPHPTHHLADGERAAVPAHPGSGSMRLA